MKTSELNNHLFESFDIESIISKIRVARSKLDNEINHKIDIDLISTIVTDTIKLLKVRTAHNTKITELEDLAQNLIRTIDRKISNLDFIEFIKTKDILDLKSYLQILKGKIREFTFEQRKRYSSSINGGNF